MWFSKVRQLIRAQRRWPEVKVQWVSQPIIKTKERKSKQAHLLPLADGKPSPVLLGGKIGQGVSLPSCYFWIDSQGPHLCLLGSQLITVLGGLLQRWSRSEKKNYLFLLSLPITENRGIPVREIPVRDQDTWSEPSRVQSQTYNLWNDQHYQGFASQLEHALSQLPFMCARKLDYEHKIPGKESGL